MKNIPSIIVVLLVLLCSTAHAQRVTYRVVDGKKVNLQRELADSLRYAELARDSLRSIDSISTDPLVLDSLAKRLQLRDLMLQDTLSKDDSVKMELLSKKLNLQTAELYDSLDRRYLELGLTVDQIERRNRLRNDSIQAQKNLELLSRRFRMRYDTMSPGAHLAMSFVPGLGQYYNNQYVKIPVIYAGIGGFVAGGAITSSRYKDYKAQYQTALNLNQPPEVRDALQRKMQSLGSTRTTLYALAAASYLYQVADATFNYRGYTNPVRKSTVLAAVFPGAGFMYTKAYWRLPIYYGGFIIIGTVIDFNNRSFQRYKTAYDALTDGNPATVDEFNGRFTAEALANVRDGYRRDRDFGIILMAGAYILSVVDTFVIATLKNWDVSDDLALEVTPTIFEDNSMRAQGYGLPSGAGMALRLKF